MTDLLVVGGAAGSAARLEELEAMAGALADRAADCGALAGSAARAAASTAAAAGTGGAAAPAFLRLAAEGSQAACHLVRAAGRLVAAAGSVVATTAAYRAREESLLALAEGVPLTAGVLLRAWLGGPVPGPAGGLLLGRAAVLGVMATGAAVGTGSAADPGVPARQVAPHPLLVDVAARTLPGVLGARDAQRLARAVTVLGRAGGVVVDGDVAVRPVAAAPSCALGHGVAGGRRDGPAAGVADLLGRGQSVASRREPAPGHHDPLPAGAPRPGPGEVRVDRVVGSDGEVAWVVHVPGTQEWDVDGEGSPMDMAANLALVGGTGTAVTAGVTEAVRRAGVRPGQPVLLVGHSQGGLTAAHLAGDPAFRRYATVTHVVTAGSPLSGRPPPDGVQVLALEHTDDLVPRLDGRAHHGYRDRPDRTTVTTTAPDGPWRTDAVPAHSSSAYVVTGEAVDASDEPSLVAYRDSLAPFLDRDGATCTSSRHALQRVPPPGRGGG